MAQDASRALAATPTSAARPRLGDFSELVKPRITMMVVVTAVAGFVASSAARGEVRLLAFAVTGTALACMGASALNQLLERESDALMERTRRRPLPSGTMTPREVLGIGLGLVASGFLMLAIEANLLTAALSILTVASYVLCYTPLKKRTTLAILVGAVPGAIPPVMGVTAATGSLTPLALALFLILFLWQIPHFLAIDWLCREDYARAGFRTSAVLDPSGRRTAWQALLFLLLLAPASLLPRLLGFAGPVYTIGAIPLGMIYLAAGVRLALRRTDESARRLLLASVTYLPLLLFMLSVERLPRLLW